MIDLSKVEKYGENNRIEAKKSMGGFPQSVWETYSAFANTMGGIILLGVEERKDTSLRPLCLPDPEKLVREFWETVNDKTKVSVNVLTKKQVQIHRGEGQAIVVITVPKAARGDRPVYVGGNPFTGTYRRSGEGDYRCSHAEVEGMLRDATKKSADERALKNFSLESLDGESIERYRNAVKTAVGEGAWRESRGEAFLLEIGAMTVEKGRSYPTAAGLLALGREEEIRRAYPNYALSYRGEPFSGNLLQFYFYAYERLSAGEKEPVCSAIREALVNTLVNADYHGVGGVQVAYAGEKITLSNPGDFRVDIQRAKKGGASDPRNGRLMRIFAALGLSEGLGNGLPRIYETWKAQGWQPPTIEERFSPPRITLHLWKVGRSAGKAAGRSAAQFALNQTIIEYLTVHISASAGELSREFSLSLSQVRSALDALCRAGVVVAVGKTRNRRYKLKR